MINRSDKAGGRAEGRREYIFCHGRPEGNTLVRKSNDSFADCQFLLDWNVRNMYICICVRVYMCTYVPRARAIARRVAPCIEVRARPGRIDNPFNPKKYSGFVRKNITIAGNQFAKREREGREEVSYARSHRFEKFVLQLF